ncbi:rano class II histocompatibility antigen, A beta chain-like [Cheilinus undulatus]|uniref:rano class II histocompatibility antigen, A beta chain-like n=1 Tax=Cheilinus undulatus TaxID=241271 RepID=UPI001BD450AD|nr:rano class II histocompatibility antigen, A beta chain-like [Cheilinus undulatus]
MASLFLSFSLLFISLCTADGSMVTSAMDCMFNSSNANDIEYTWSTYYNRMEVVRFSSSVGWFVSLHEYMDSVAEGLNNDTQLILNQRLMKYTVCQPNSMVWYDTTLSKSVKPYASLQSETPPAGKHPAMLVCSAYKFYPKEIKVSWLIDGQEVTSDVSITDAWSDGDWYYQIHSYLEYTPKSAQNITCVVEHISLDSPLYTHWDPFLSNSDRIKTAIGATGLALGLFVLLVGFIYYKTKPHGRIRVPCRIADA